MISLHKGLNPWILLSSPRLNLLKVPLPFHHSPIFDGKVQYSQGLSMLPGLNNEGIADLDRVQKFRMRMSTYDDIDPLHCFSKPPVRMKTDVRKYQDQIGLAF